MFISQVVVGGVVVLDCIILNCVSKLNNVIFCKDRIYVRAITDVVFYRSGYWVDILCSSLFFSCWPNVYPSVSVLQATAEQIRLAQMIYDKNDADFEDKVNQVRDT